MWMTHQSTKMTRTSLLVALAIMTGCVSAPNDRICLDWKTRTEIREKCVPLYGSMICADEQRTINTCILYEEVAHEKLTYSTQRHTSTGASVEA